MPTATGLRISSVNGTAFLDNCPADILAAVGAQVKIYDASSRYLQGVIDVAGSSETLDSDLFSGLNFTSGWSVANATINDADSLTFKAIYGIVYKASILTIGALYKGSFDYTITSGTGTIQANADGYEIKLAKSSSGLYRTNLRTGFRVQMLSGTAPISGDITTMALQKVTAPSSSGVIIKDLSGNQNFISKDANFTYNAASYVYEILNVATASQSVFLRKIFQRGF